MSKASELDQKVKRYILEQVDGSAYNVETETDTQKIKFLQDTFDKEYGFAVRTIGRQAAVQGWLQGLPSACTVAFTNHDILELAQDWGSLPADATEAQEQRILANWFKLVAAKTCQLFDHRNLPLPAGYEIETAIDGRFMVLCDGVQIGDDVDAAGAGNDTYFTKTAARLAARMHAADK